MCETNDSGYKKEAQIENKISVSKFETKKLLMPIKSSAVVLLLRSRWMN